MKVNAVYLKIYPSSLKCLNSPEISCQHCEFPQNPCDSKKGICPLDGKNMRLLRIVGLIDEACTSNAGITPVHQIDPLVAECATRKITPGSLPNKMKCI